MRKLVITLEHEPNILFFCVSNSLKNADEMIFLNLFLFVRITTEDTRALVRPQTTQKWKHNKQAGGGAVIPCTWRLHVKKGLEQFQMW